MKKIIMALLLTGALFTSCKKDDNPKTTKEKVTGNWTAQTVIYKWTTTDGDMYADTTAFDAGSTFSFNSDGSFKAKFKVDGESQETSGSWSLSGDTAVVVNVPDDEGGTFKISELTSNSLELYLKETGSSGIDETWFKLKK